MKAGKIVGLSIRGKGEGALPYSILYVDDDTDLLDLGKEFLETTREFTVRTSESAVKARALLRERRFDAIISDYVMAGMDGIAFLKHVRAEYGDLPFIIFTGRGREEVVIEALNNGADYYLQKGSDVEAVYAELRHVVMRAIEIRQARLTLAEQEQRFHDLQNANDMIQSVDPQGRFLFTNKKWQDTLGYGKEDLPFLSLFDTIHEESREDCMAIFPRVLAGEDVGIIDVVFRAKDGRKVYAEGFASCKIVDGKPQYTRGIFKDVTDRRVTEQALKESEEKFRTIFNSSPYPIAISSMPDQKFIAVNPSFLEVSGYMEEEILGKNPVELGLLTLPESAKLVSRAVLSGGKIENVPLALTGKEGRRVHVIFSCIPITIGGQSATVTVTAEVTRLKRVEEELIQKNEELQSACEDLTTTEEELRANYEELHERERALRESEEKYRLLTEATSDVIYMMDLDGTLTHVSPQIARYGYTPEEVCSRTFTDFLEEDDILRAVADMETTIRTGESTVTPLKLRDRDGNIHWLEDNGAAVRDASGRIVAISGILRDITERREMELALRESEEKFRALVENALEGIFIIDFSGNLLFANPSALRIVGIDDLPSAAGTLNVMSFVAPESMPEVLKDVAMVARGIDAYLVQYKLITAKKGEIWVECIGKKIIFGGGSAMLVSMRDITGRRKAEEALRESESRLATLFRSSPVAMTLVAARDGRFVDVNDAFIESTGFDRREVIGKTAAEIRLFADNADYERLPSALKSGRRVRGMEIRCRIKDGRVRTCRLNSTVISMNWIPHILSTIENITEQKEAEAALRTLVKSMVGGTGIDSLHTITENVAAWLGADCVMVSERSPDGKTLAARSMVLDGKRVTSFACPLPGTPCNTVAEGGFRFYGDNLAQVFPGTDIVAEFGFNAYIGTPLRGSNGEVFGVLSAFFRTAQQSPAAYREILDIMAVKAAAEIERTRVDQILRESEEKFRTLVENSLDGILIIDMAGKILFANQAMAGMVASSDGLGTGRHNGGRDVLEFIAPGARDAVIRDIRKVKEGGDSAMVRYPAVTTTGKQIWIEGIGRRILFRNAPAILVSVRDITARKQLEEALLRTNKQLSLLSSITRHDVLNKITIIQGHIALAQRQGTSPDYPALLGKIAMLINVIRQQVEFTRMYQNLGTKEPVWQKAGQFLTPASVPGSVRLTGDIGGLEIYSDLMLEKVFHNLVDNSLRHGGKVTEIRLAAHPGENGLTIAYEDNGVGIPADEKEQIFVRGYGKNTGLGLFLAREILGITGITIKENGEPGRGARFEIVVPAGAYRLPAP